MTDGTKLAVAILEDDDNTRAELERHIQDLDLEVAGAASTLAEAEALIKRDPDVFLVDLQLPDGVAFGFIRSLKRSTDCKVLVVTTLGDEASVVSAIRAGSEGYVVKDANRETLREAIDNLLAGESPLSPSIARYLVRRVRQSRGERPSAEIASLTRRELDVLESLSRGYNYKEVAIDLGLSHHTVAQYIKSVYRKLRVNSRAEAVLEAVKHGVVDL